MTVSSDREPPEELHPLPDCPELALFVVGAFQRLGGYLTIGDNGKRYAGRPECPSMDCEAGRPQMLAAKPWEQFHNDDEWRGAIKLADYWLHRLSERDKELVYTLVAPGCFNPQKTFDFREQML